MPSTLERSYSHSALYEPARASNSLTESIPITRFPISPVAPPAVARPSLTKKIRSSDVRSAEMIGASKGLRRVAELVRVVGPTPSTVLIQGETGSGKELVARAVHLHSTRRNRPFVKINCSAIPAGLVESELFGHERGAFTGAVQRRVGRFEEASTGTLFLDEIGDVPLELQAKLLRVLQEGEIERLGGGSTRRVDVRLIAATNRDLLSLVHKKLFRSDLYYRLNVFPITVPPLRKRREDIPLLVRHFVTRCSEKMNKHIGEIAPAVMESLTSHSWPGNIRELQNVIERSMILTTSGEPLHPPFDAA